MDRAAIRSLLAPAVLAAALLAGTTACSADAASGITRNEQDKSSPIGGIQGSAVPPSASPTVTSTGTAVTGASPSASVATPTP